MSVSRASGTPCGSVFGRFYVSLMPLVWPGGMPVALKFAGPCAQSVLDPVIIPCSISLCPGCACAFCSIILDLIRGHPWGHWIRKCGPWCLPGASLVPPWCFVVMGRDAFDRFWLVLAPSWGQLWANLVQLWPTWPQLWPT